MADPMTPQWWLERLLAKLAKDYARLDRLDRYYRNEADLPEGSSGYVDAFRRFQRKARTNWAALASEAVSDRMMPVGFRTGSTGTAGMDADAWRIWQANSLDADASLVHIAMLNMSRSYVMVGGYDPVRGAPVITAEDPRQVITEQDPTARRRSIAALKVYHDDLTAADTAVLYLPGYVLRATRANASQYDNTHEAITGGDWRWTSYDRMPLEQVPIVRFGNRMDIGGTCTLGEYEDAIDVIDRINATILNRLVIAAMQAFRQRAIKGDLPEKDSNGNVIDYNGIFRGGPDALWLLPEGAEMWESAQADLNGILQAVRHDVQDFAATTKTPLFYLTPDAANGSAEGASLAREGLVFKVKDRCRQAGEAWEQVMTLAFASEGNLLASSRPDMEVIWAPPESFSLAERFDAASKAVAVGVPWAERMRLLGYSPQEIDRLLPLHEAEQPVTMSSSPAPPAPSPVPVPA